MFSFFPPPQTLFLLPRVGLKIDITQRSEASPEIICLRTEREYRVEKRDMKRGGEGQRQREDGRNEKVLVDRGQLVIGKAIRRLGF